MTGSGFDADGGKLVGEELRLGLTETASTEVRCADLPMHGTTALQAEPPRDIPARHRSNPQPVERKRSKRPVQPDLRSYEVSGVGRPNLGAGAKRADESPGNGGLVLIHQVIHQYDLDPTMEGVTDNEQSLVDLSGGHPRRPGMGSLGTGKQRWRQRPRELTDRR